MTERSEKPTLPSGQVNPIVKPQDASATIGVPGVKPGRQGSHAVFPQVKTISDADVKEFKRTAKLVEYSEECGSVRAWVNDKGEILIDSVAVIDEREKQKNSLRVWTPNTLPAKPA